MSKRNYEFAEMLLVLGLTLEELWAITNSIPITSRYSDGYYVSTSKLVPEESGVFTTEARELGSVIGVVAARGEKTLLGRFTNHDSHPNCEMVYLEGCGEYAFVALHEIAAGSELTVCYVSNSEILRK